MERTLEKLLEKITPESPREAWVHPRARPERSIAFDRYVEQIEVIHKKKRGPRT